MGDRQFGMSFLTLPIYYSQPTTNSSQQASEKCFLKITSVSVLQIKTRTQTLLSLNESLSRSNCVSLSE